MNYAWPHRPVIAIVISQSCMHAASLLTIRNRIKSIKPLTKTGSKHHDWLARVNHVQDSLHNII